MHPETIGGLLKALGVPNVPGRTSAIEASTSGGTAAPVVADALGYHPVTTTKLAPGGRSHLEPLVTAPRFQSPEGWTPSRTHDS